ncbi:chemotaxis-specific protein-glutamate methyltransferase CheB [Sandaracinus amylolyticus]|uniref:Protein-glutamate methylesterase/protein-glutamine glutaminase n=1 Tax=Sandaracinus amylolyticus TaxID=927083 RepID=A0A0F6SFQ6_9BACT|nr:chemotaxis-specific protein-glutamate methyltransferase CheB [Sandaracinus amylolyticus]AKF07359.1 Chemotaxis response regulator protein-glutamate methylesterase CheB [Sandaracinus amylolyticus]
MSAPHRKVRVLVCDDSAFARKVLRDVLSRSDRIEVVDAARDGIDALEKIATLRPDVITLDLVMPNLDGLGVLAAMPAVDAPRVVVVSSSASESDLVVRALELGAITTIEKPTALATERLYELAGAVERAVLLAAEAKVHPAATATPVTPIVVAPQAARTKLLVLGASTGGPRAITRVLSALPASFPVPIAVVLHMPVGYTEAFAARVDEASPLEVLEARDGLELVPGRVVVARAGMHLSIVREDERVVCALDVLPLETPHRPAVDVLFRSAAKVFGADVLGVVLTGMGNDGLAGARDLVAANAQVIVEDASTCVVYGMPRSVAEAGLAAAEVPIDAMAAEIVARVAQEP